MFSFFTLFLSQSYHTTPHYTHQHNSNEELNKEREREVTIFPTH
jgi:hypothetical protein